jgi:hypothetical protein
VSVRSKRRGVFVVTLVMWIGAIGAGAASLLRYSNTPGDLAAPPEQWPAQTALRRSPGRAMLVMFAHPQCPCSAASMEELAQIVTRADDKVDTYVLFYAPEQAATEWVKSDLWESAARLPGVRPMEDREGREIRVFHAATSGQILLYNASGRLAFNGGIMARRGHAGPSDGRDAILSLLLNGIQLEKTTPVFGCSLLGAAQ